MVAPRTLRLFVPRPKRAAIGKSEVDNRILVAHSPPGEYTDAHSYNERPWEILGLVEAEGDFDRDDVATGLPRGADGRLELPALHGSMAFSSRPRPGPFTTEMLMALPSVVMVTCKHDRALILGFAGFVGILRSRAVQAHRNANAVHAGAKSAAASAAAFARTQAAAGAAANARAIADAQANRTALTASGSPNVPIVGLGTFKSGGPSSDGSIASFGVGFSILICGGVNCVHLNLGSLPLFSGVSV